MGTFYRKKREYLTMGALSTGRVGRTLLTVREEPFLHLGHFLYWKRRALLTLGALSISRGGHFLHWMDTSYRITRALSTYKKRE